MATSIDELTDGNELLNIAEKARNIIVGSAKPAKRKDVEVALNELLEVERELTIREGA